MKKQQESAPGEKQKDYRKSGSLYKSSNKEDLK
jgi:hypothetical protein